MHHTSRDDHTYDSKDREDDGPQGQYLSAYGAKHEVTSVSYKWMVSSDREKTTCAYEEMLTHVVHIWMIQLEIY